MSRQINDQTPLGELLQNARLSLRLSRHDVASATGINVNSLTRYERAGLDDDGQYPPSPKLALLCFFLRLHPLKVLLSCLSYGDYWHVKTIVSEEKFSWEDGHPDYEYMMGEVFRLRAENDLFRCALNALFEIEDPEINDDVRTALVARVREQLVAQARIRKEFSDAGALKSVHFGFGIPGIPFDRREEASATGLKHEQARKWWEVTTQPPPKQTNGPDQKDPSRPVQPSKPKNVAPTTSKRPQKGARRDDSDNDAK